MPISHADPGLQTRATKARSRLDQADALVEDSWFSKVVGLIPDLDPEQGKSAPAAD
jgi:hypothetical protein